jgi:hypothetical protein
MNAWLSLPVAAEGSGRELRVRCQEFTKRLLLAVNLAGERAGNLPFVKMVRADPVGLSPQHLLDACSLLERVHSAEDAEG